MKGVDDNQVEDNENFRRFLIKKYRHEMFYFFLVCCAIAVLRFFDIIDTCTASTVFAAAVGFFVSGIRKIHD